MVPFQVFFIVVKHHLHLASALMIDIDEPAGGVFQESVGQGPSNEILVYHPGVVTHTGPPKYVTELSLQELVIKTTAW